MPNRFGMLLQVLLADRNITANDFVRVLRDEGFAAYPELVHYWKYGYRIPEPDVLDVIARVLKLDKDNTTNLHTAAALDKGYRV